MQEFRDEERLLRQPEHPGGVERPDVRMGIDDPHAQPRGARKSETITPKVSAYSIWVQCPQWPNTCSCAFGSKLKISYEADTGTTRSSRPWITRVSLGTLATSSGFQAGRSIHCWRGAGNI